MFREATELGMEVAAYPSRRECEQTQQIRFGDGSQWYMARRGQIRCERIEGTTTAGKGYHMDGRRAQEVCLEGGNCVEIGPENPIFATFFTLVRMALARGLKMPTYTSRETCEETLSFALDELLARHTAHNAEVIRKVVKENPVTTESFAAKMASGMKPNTLALDEEGHLKYAVITATGEEAKLSAKVRCTRY